MDFENEEILKFAIENGMINKNTILQELQMRKERDILNSHKYAIWQGADGFYNTYVPCHGNAESRKRIRKKDRADLERAIVESYKESSKVHIDDVYAEWIERKMYYGEIQEQTRQRYDVDFKRFIKTSFLNKKEFKRINEYDLEDFIRDTIHDNGLSSKAYGNLRTLLIGVFKHGKRKGYTKLSISVFFGDLDLSRRMFRHSHKDDSECIFTQEEVERLEKDLWAHKNIQHLGVLLALYTGMRVGEVCALDADDITDKYIKVRKTQIRISNSYSVKDSPKTESGFRNIVITSNVRRVLDEILAINPRGVLMAVNGEQCTKQALLMTLYRSCRRLKIKQRSMHALRKTFATRLIDAEVDESIIINQMGHTDISTTKHYYYFNDKGYDAMKDKLERAF